MSLDPIIYSRVYEQSAVAVNSSTLRADLQAIAARQEAGLDSDQSLAAIGQTIPIVFCQRSGSTGGVWLSPPAIRWAFQVDKGKITFNSLLVISDGKCSGIAQADIYHGATRLDSSPAWAYQNTYGTVPTTYGFNFVNNIKLDQTYDITEIYDAAQGPAGLPFPDPAVFRRQSTNEIVVTSKGPNPIAFSAKIAGKTTYEYRGPLLEGQPWYIRDAVHSNYDPDDPDSFWAKYNWASLVSRVFVKSATDTSVNWLLKLSSVTEADGRKTYTARFYNPYRDGYGVLYPRNVIPFTGTITQGVIDTALGNAYNTSALTSQSVTALSVIGARPESNIASAGTTMTVVEDSYKVTVTETNRYTYPNPSGFSTEAGSGGSLQGLSLLGVKATYDNTAGKHGRQVHVFVRSGVTVERMIDGATAASNLYPDLVYYLMTQVALVPSLLIDKASLKTAAQFTNAQGLYFNGVVQAGVNLRSWLAEVSPYFLLQVTQFNGRYGLRPALPTVGTNISTAAITPLHTFTEKEIIGPSFVRQSVEASDLKPFIAVMVWREQPENNVGTTKTVEVQYRDTAGNAPQEQYDLSEFCVTEAHAVKAARYLLARRRHTRYTAQWQADASGALLNPGDIVRVTLPIVTSAGGDSTFSALYQISSVSESANGAISIGAVEFPVDSSGRSLVAMDVVSGAFS